MDPRHTLFHPHVNIHKAKIKFIKKRRRPEHFLLNHMKNQEKQELIKNAVTDQKNKNKNSTNLCISWDNFS